MKRRTFIGGAVGTAVVPGLSGCEPAGDPIRFDHGVASGDPLADGVILWTRVSGTSADSVAVDWAVAADEELEETIASGTVTTGPDRDYTVKVDASGLPSGKTLYYRFTANGHASPTGRTKTLPTGDFGSAAFAVVSCSNHPYGYFHLYREIANAAGLDAVIHLGDYIYEYGVGEYATEFAEALGRIPDPPHEVVTLGDFRRRHAQYKADADSMAMHAALPLIAVWDDHELCNDSWRDGAENHQPEEEGSWPDRRDAAIQAWLEWMPVRAGHSGADTEIYRHYEFGDLLSLTMLDTRLVGRDMQPNVGEGVTPEIIGERLQDPARGLLGERQADWLRDRLAESDATWQVIGQQVLVCPLHSADLEPLIDLEREAALPRETLEEYIALSKGNPRLLFDTWDGYPFAREAFLATLNEYANNPVVLSGDLHTSLAGNLIPSGSETPVAVELMTGSVTSPGFAEYLPEREPGVVRDATMEINPWLAYLETSSRAWLRVLVTPERLIGEWNLISTVHERDYTMSVDKRLQVIAGAVGEGLKPA